jgi:sigma-B regulation protein RsbU (phosphoserine phosphatase)
VEGVPLGLLDDREYEQVSIQVKRDDTILLFSDGIEDQLREKEEDFGRDRFSAIVTANSQLPPQEIVQKVFDGLDAFRGATPLTDDQTFIVLKVL